MPDPVYCPHHSTSVSESVFSFQSVQKTMSNQTNTGPVANCHIAGKLNVVPHGLPHQLPSVLKEGSLLSIWWERRCRSPSWRKGHEATAIPQMKKFRAKNIDHSFLNSVTRCFCLGVGTLSTDILSMYCTYSYLHTNSTWLAHVKHTQLVLPHWFWYSSGILTFGQSQLGPGICCRKQ